MSENWDIPSAIALYNIDRWGSGYFTINRFGNIQVMPGNMPGMEEETSSEATPLEDVSGPADGGEDSAEEPE